MKLPFVSRFAYDEMKSELTARALKAEADREKMLNKILRLSVGSDGEPQAQTEPVADEKPEAEEPEILTDYQLAVRMAGGSKRPSIIRRMIERINAGKHAPQTSRLAAVSEMSEAFDKGAAS